MNNPIEDLVLRAADPADRRRGASIFARAMGRDDRAVMDELYRFSSTLADSNLGHFLVAQTGERIVGYGALVSYIKVGWIAFMGTEPELQGHGIGGQMLEAIKALAEDMGIGTLKLDATKVGTKLYSKHGFKEEYPVRSYQIPAQCGPTPTPNRSVSADETVKIASTLPEWCFTLDRQACGDSRRALLERLLKDGGKALLVEGHGFGIFSGRRLGPVLSDNLQAAIDIVQRAGNLGANVVYVPRHLEMPEEFLSILKQREPEAKVTCCTRMHWGNPVAEDISKIFAAYSAATG